jgi:hypothetical protein
MGDVPFTIRSIVRSEEGGNVFADTGEYLFTVTDRGVEQLQEAHPDLEVIEPLPNPTPLPSTAVTLNTGSNTIVEGDLVSLDSAGHLHPIESWEQGTTILGVALQSGKGSIPVATQQGASVYMNLDSMGAGSTAIGSPLYKSGTEDGKVTPHEPTQDVMQVGIALDVVGYGLGPEAGNRILAALLFHAKPKIEIN